VTGYKSFDSFKKAMGPAGPGKQWHHVVEQHPGNIAKFGPHMIHNTGNLVRVEKGGHVQVSSWYSRLQRDEGVTVRDTLRNKDFEAQHSYGLTVLRQFGGI